MGTNGLIKLYAIKKRATKPTPGEKIKSDHKAEDVQTYGCIYKQFDSYLSGLGLELYDFLKDMKIVNGISNRNTGKIANGSGCLYAQLISYLKNKHGGRFMAPPGCKAGSVYLVPIEDITEDHWQEYTYNIRVYNEGENDFFITVSVNNDEEMNLEDFGVLCKSEE